MGADGGNILLVTSFAALSLLLWLTARCYGGWRIERWARLSGYELISFQDAEFHAGYTAWYRSENRREYRIVVLDGDAQRRSGWLSFSNALPVTRAVTIAWDDAA
jgi:hypothetical protein